MIKANQKERAVLHTNSKVSQSKLFAVTHQYKSGQGVKQVPLRNGMALKMQTSGFQFIGNRTYLSVGGW